MKKLLALALFSTLAFGCSDKKSEPKTEPAAPAKTTEPAPTPTPTPTTPEPVKDPAAPAASPRIVCAAEIALVCADGFEDGCVGNRTKIHICVAKDAKAASGCETQIVHACPDGQVDGCTLNSSLTDRSVTDNHVCVLK